MPNDEPGLPRNDMRTKASAGVLWKPETAWCDETGVATGLTLDNEPDEIVSEVADNHESVIDNQESSCASFHFRSAFFADRGLVDGASRRNAGFPLALVASAQKYL